MKYLALIALSGTLIGLASYYICARYVFSRNLLPNGQLLRFLWVLSIPIWIGLGIIIAVLLYGTPAHGHSAMSGWQYPPECCGGKDCHEITDVQEVKGGYMVMHKWFRPYNQAEPSPDGQFHVCTFHVWGDADEKLRCFFAPQNSM